MSIQSWFNRYGVKLETLQKQRAARDSQTITHVKPNRPAASYRGARRNALDHDAKSKRMTFKRLIEKWRDKWSCYPEVNIIRQSFIRRKPSKYMPHEAVIVGGMYKPTIHERKAPVKINQFRGFGGRNR